MSGNVTLRQGINRVIYWREFRLYKYALEEESNRPYVTQSLIYFIKNLCHYEKNNRQL